MFIWSNFPFLGSLQVKGGSYPRLIGLLMWCLCFAAGPSWKFSTFFFGAADTSASRQYSRIFCVGFLFLFFSSTGETSANQTEIIRNQNLPTEPADQNQDRVRSPNRKQQQLHLFYIQRDSRTPTNWIIFTFILLIQQTMCHKNKNFYIENVETNWR